MVDGSPVDSESARRADGRAQPCVLVRRAVQGTAVSRLRGIRPPDQLRRNGRHGLLPDPEQVTGATVGPPADIYTLGLVLLEC